MVRRAADVALENLENNDRQFALLLGALLRADCPHGKGACLAIATSFLADQVRAYMPMRRSAHRLEPRSRPPCRG